MWANELINNDEIQLNAEEYRILLSVHQAGWPEFYQRQTEIRWRVYTRMQIDNPWEDRAAEVSPTAKTVVTSSDGNMSNISQTIPAPQDGVAPPTEPKDNEDEEGQKSPSPVRFWF